MTRLYITLGKKGDLSDSECDTVVGLSISQYANLLGWIFPHKENGW